MARKAVSSDTIENTVEEVAPKTTKTTTKTKATETPSMDMEMLKLIKELQAEVKSLKAEKAAVQKEVAIAPVIEDNSTRTVKVISMMNNSYNLSTEPLGKGKLYNFSKYGEFKNIRFSDLQDIINIFGYQFEKGMAVFSNRKDYEDLKLGYVYDNILDQEKMEDLLKLNSMDYVGVIKNMDKDMQDNVMSLVASRIVSGQEKYDFNIIELLKDFTNLEQFIKLAKEEL